MNKCSNEQLTNKINDLINIFQTVSIFQNMTFYESHVFPLCLKLCYTWNTLMKAIKFLK